MTEIQQHGSDSRHQHDVLRGKRPISERRLQANRANAQRSTGPRTEAGKAASRRNALKHGILSRTVDLPSTGLGLASLLGSGPNVSAALGTDSALKEIDRIWDKLTRVVLFEKECSRRLGGLEHNARLICRYERMLTRQFHAQIRECAGLVGKE